LHLQLAHQDKQLHDAQQAAAKAASTPSATAASSSSPPPTSTTTSSSSTSSSSSAVAASSGGDGGAAALAAAAAAEAAASELAMVREALREREAALAAVMADKALLAAQVDAVRAEAQGELTTERIRLSAVYRALEERLDVAAAQASEAARQMEEMQQSLTAQQAQRRHDHEQRNRLHLAQLQVQEEKIQAMELKLRKVQTERDQAQHELEQRRADKPAAQVLRQLSDELAAQARRLYDAQEQKKSFLERIADLKRTASRLDRGVAQSQGEATAELQRRLEERDRECEAMLVEMGHMESAVNRAQEDNARLHRQIAEAEEATLHHILERTKWTKLQQAAAKKTELVAEKALKADERIKLHEATQQQQQAKVTALEHQLRAKHEETTQLLSRLDARDRSERDLALLVNDMQLQLEEARALLSAAQPSAQREHAQIDQLRHANLELKDQLSAAQHRPPPTLARAASSAGLQSSSGSSDLQLEQYKKQLRCGVCNERPKAVILTRCFHLFCKACIDDNMEKRIRKCPICYTGFGDRDVHAVYF